MGSKPYNHTLGRNILLVIGATLSGYTVMLFPKNVLLYLTNPIAQFAIFWVLAYGLYWNHLPGGGWFVFLDALFFVILTQLTTFMLHYYFPDIKKKRVNQLSINYTPHGAQVSGVLPNSEHQLKWEWDDDHRLSVWAQPHGRKENKVPDQPVSQFIPLS